MGELEVRGDGPGTARQGQLVGASAAARRSPPVRVSSQASSLIARVRHSVQAVRLRDDAAPRSKACSLAAASLSRQQRPMTSSASHASSWSPSASAVARARSASGSAASGWPWPSADWAATVSTRALRSSSAASAAHVACAGEVLVGDVPDPRRHGRPGDAEVRVRTPGGGAVDHPELMGHARADDDRLVGLPGQREDLRGDLVDVRLESRVGRRRPGPVEDLLGGAQRSRRQRPARELQQQGGRALVLPGPLGQAGRHLAPLAGQPRVRGLDRVEDGAGDEPALGGQQVVEHGVPGQRVPEAELRPGLGDQQLRVDAGPERRHHLEVGHLRGSWQQRPVEASPQDGRHLQHAGRLGAEPAQPAAHAVHEAHGQRGAGLGVERPPLAVPRERTRADGTGEHLLHHERQPVGPGPHVLHHPARYVVRAEAGGRHPPEVVGRQRVELQDGRRPGGHQALQQAQRRAGLLGPHGRDAQHGLGPERVDEVLEHGERLLVRPVEVLEHQQHGRTRRPPR